MEDLDSGSQEQQISAMYYFGYSKNKACFWYLVKNLDRTIDSEDRNPLGERLRTAAAEAMGRLGDDRAVPFLLKRYRQEKRDGVKRAIIGSLSNFRDKDILPVLKDALQSDNRDLLMESMQCAASYGDSSVVPKIREIREKQEDAGLRLMSSYALVRLGDEPDKNTELLRKDIINSDPAIRFWSAYCLSRTDRIEAIGDLLRALEIENCPWVRKEIEIAVVQLARKKRDAEE